MLIGELVKKSGLKKSTIRHYEDMGLIKPRLRQAGSRHYREYDDDILQRIEIIKNGKKMGFSVKEGKEIIDAILSQTLSKNERISIMQDKVTDIEQKIGELQQMKSLLQEKINLIND